LLAGAPSSAAERPLHAALGASDAWTIIGSQRTRIEGISGQFRPTAADNDVLLSMQTRLFAEYDAAPVRFGGEITDARGYFQRTGSSAGTGEINAVELTQAYLRFDLHDALGTATSATLTAGRMTIDTGSRRLVARNNFRNTINAFTGLRLDWSNAARDRLVLLWVLPHRRLPDDPAGIAGNAVVFDRESPDQQLFGASFTKAAVLGGSLEVYGYGLVEHDAPGFRTANRRLFTPGIRLLRPPAKGRFDYELEAIFQTGTARATTAASDVRDLAVSAWFVHFEIGRSFDVPWQPRVSIAYDRASGDGDNPATYNRFDTLFGARRAEYGPTSLFGAIGRANLNSPSLHIQATPDTRWDTLFSWRPLWLDSASDSFSSTGVRDRSGGSGRFAGHQIEARVRWWVVPNSLRADIGSAVLVKSDFLRLAPNGRDNGDTKYGYFDLTWGF
jgi:hypothetical protein